MRQLVPDRVRDAGSSLTPAGRPLTLDQTHRERFELPMRRARLLPVVVLTLLPAAAWPQGVPLGPEFRVNTFTTNSQWFPAVAADALGNFVVLWASSTQDYAATSGVFGQRYTSGGEALGPEFRVNTYTIGSQGAGAVAS